MSTGSVKVNRLYLCAVVFGNVNYLLLTTGRSTEMFETPVLLNCYLLVCYVAVTTRSSYYLNLFFYFSIRITCPCDLYSLTPHFYIVKLEFTGVYIIFLFLL